MSQRKPVIVLDEDETYHSKTDEELAILLQNQENEGFYTNVEDLLDDSSNSELTANVGDLIEELDPEPFPGN